MPIDVTKLPDLTITGVQLFVEQVGVWYGLNIMCRPEAPHWRPGYLVNLFCSDGDDGRLDTLRHLETKRWKTQRGALKAGLKALEQLGWNPEVRDAEDAAGR